MDIKEAISIAIEFEKGVVDVYNQYADKFESEVGKKIFKALGKEEVDHAAYLEAKLAQWTAEGKVTLEGMDTIVPGADLLTEHVGKLAKSFSGEVKESEIEAFKKALKMEQDATNFYNDLVGKLPKEDQELFQRFLEIEAGHEAIIKAELDNVKGLGYWFDFMEFDLESA